MALWNSDHLMNTSELNKTSASKDLKPVFLNWSSMHNVSYILLAIIFASVLGSGYYYTSSYKFSQRISENKKSMLELVTAFVSTYSQQRTLDNQLHLPVPGAFRQSSLKLFDKVNSVDYGIRIKFFDLTGPTVKANPPDEQIVNVIGQMSVDRLPGIWSGYVGGFGKEVLRTIKPVLTTGKSCADCGNSSAEPNKAGMSGAVMSAYVVDVPTSGFFKRLRLEAGGLALGAFLFLWGSIAYFMQQQARIASVKAENLRGSERRSMLSAAKKQAENETAKLSAQVRKAYEDLRQALTKERELNVLQRQFISMASHEFRTPLAIIDGAAQRLERRAKKFDNSVEIAKRAVKIRGAVERMTRVMESTLTAASLDIGKLSISVEPCDMAKQLNDACQRQMELTGSHNISCDASGLPATIQADPGSLEQIFSNLLSNAVKYAPNAPEINVRAYSEDGEVVLSVRDYGLGIDEEDLPRVFERFFRARTATGIAGSGIGLNLIKILIELHDGSITLESIINKGSIFTVRLPVNGPEEIGAKGDEVA